MNNRFLKGLKARKNFKWTTPIYLLIGIILFFYAIKKDHGYELFYLTCFVAFLLLFRPDSRLHMITMDRSTQQKSRCTAIIALLTIAILILPMGDLPIWNGEIPDHRNQYELMAESIIDGRLDIPCDDMDGIASLENPYDPNERDLSGVHYHWDHAYYDGHYYMYFGIVPVLLLFLPYRVITGTALTTFHATQIFTALSVAGIFLLFHLLSKLFFRKLPYTVYLALSIAFSAMSVWYAAAEPALYCTAITAAIALEIWSLIFFIYAVWGEKDENRQLAFAWLGAVLGALTFGCRPSVALANILVIPMLVVFLKQRKFSFKLLCKLILTAVPYVIVAAMLMYYNDARFGDPFEFGQTYQLTTADQTAYKFELNKTSLLRIFNDTTKTLFSPGSLQENFPYLPESGVFFYFPILLLIFGVLRSNTVTLMKQTKTLALLITLIASVLLIIAVDVMWTPYLLERYRMDIYYLLGIGCFLVVGFWYNSSTEKQQKHLVTTILALAFLTVINSFLLYIGTVGGYYPEKIDLFKEFLHLQ